ncbi:2,4-dienoyl-CoA reductase [Pedococcus cremeus]|uniref:2,4-dienoyl-CoA reductase n=1 Tax=Pedococcus cremeus TaxID=587636 RepID=A0A1H9XBM9_9MICO|nr:NADH:flavin oxidoreductase/NADH oxidase [Pedococcus cremeus]SES43580.1 2,4-dienoyl-CoA reductase [Pedococcus cremeus]
MARTLFDPITLRSTEVRNRIWVSPMCQYSATDGVVNDWHLVHLGSFARGGAGLVFTEAAAVSPEGRISPQDAGIWNDEQVQAWSRITEFIRSQGATPGIQLAHAGRKASVNPPWVHGTAGPDEGGWEPVGPDGNAFGRLLIPRALSLAEVQEVPGLFAAAAERALRAGFEVLEIHAAHGYLLHELLSPLSNSRTDAYGGDFEGRTRLLMETYAAVRAAVGEDAPVVVRLSATDWVEGGWSLDDTVQVSRLLAAAGADLIDCSSGGNDPRQEITVGPGYQVPFAAEVRRSAGVATGAVGLITEPKQAADILADGSADVVLLARELLREPHWPLRAAAELGGEVRWPEQYLRATW